MTRRNAREQAFILIFEKSFHQNDSLDEIISQAAEGRSIDVDAFAYQLASGWSSHVDEIDEQIEQHSTKWKMNRISRVALSILRLSIYELLFAEEIPDKVSINEAVELAKKFGTEEDSSFVNGVLGAVVRGKGGDKPDETVNPDKPNLPDVSAL